MGMLDTINADNRICAGLSPLHAKFSASLLNCMPETTNMQLENEGKPARVCFQVRLAEAVCTHQHMQLQFCTTSLIFSYNLGQIIWQCNADKCDCHKAVSCSPCQATDVPQHTTSPSTSHSPLCRTSSGSFSSLGVCRCRKSAARGLCKLGD